MINSFKLNELGSVNRGKSKHRPRNDPDLYNGEYPFIQTGDVKHSPFYVTSHSQSYNDKGLSQSKLWPKGTLCITIAANIADTAILSYPACFPDSIIGFLPNKEKSDVKYVKYCLDTFQLQMKSISQGTTQDNMSLEKLLSIEFPAPELKIQKKIAAILSAYDDLIENNKRRISLLENMAEEIHREWFVRFRFPGYQTTEFEKGIPKGWVSTTIGDSKIQVIDGDRGKSYPNKSEFSDKGYCLFLSASNVRKGYFDYSKCEFITKERDEKLKKGRVEIGDIIITTRGTVGNVAYFGVNAPYSRLRINSGMVIVRPQLGADTSLFYFYLLNSESIKENYTLFSSGSAQPQLPIRDMKKIGFLEPSESVINSFCKTIKPFRDMVDVHVLQNMKLNSIKADLLLRLISGKLSVENLDIQFPPSMQEDVAI
jgi:type I restriction enzyme S subunit